MFFVLPNPWAHEHRNHPCVPSRKKRKKYGSFILWQFVSGYDLDGKPWGEDWLECSVNNFASQLSIRCLKFKFQPIIRFVTLALCASQIQPQASPPGKPRAFVSRWVPGDGHLTVNNVSPPGQLQTTTILFRNILSSFPTALRFKGFKQSFWSR